MYLIVNYDSIKRYKNKNNKAIHYVISEARTSLRTSLQGLQGPGRLFLESLVPLTQLSRKVPARRSNGDHTATMRPD